MLCCAAFFQRNMYIKESIVMYRLMYNVFTNSTSHLSAHLFILTQQLLRQTKLLKVFSKVLNTQVAYVAYRSYSSCNIPCN